MDLKKCLIVIAFLSLLVNYSMMYDVTIVMIPGFQCPSVKSERQRPRHNRIITRTHSLTLKHVLFLPSPRFQTASCPSEHAQQTRLELLSPESVHEVET